MKAHIKLCKSKGAGSSQGSVLEGGESRLLKIMYIKKVKKKTDVGRPSTIASHRKESSSADSWGHSWHTIRSFSYRILIAWLFLVILTMTLVPRQNTWLT